MFSFHHTKEMEKKNWIEEGAQRKEQYKKLFIYIFVYFYDNVHELWLIVQYIILIGALLIVYKKSLFYFSLCACNIIISNIFNKYNWMCVYIAHSFELFMLSTKHKQENLLNVYTLFFSCCIKWLIVQVYYFRWFGPNEKNKRLILLCSWKILLLNKIFNFYF